MVLGGYYPLRDIYKKRRVKMNTRIQKLKENKGFTLAELLIVVAIIAVLVVIAIPVFTNNLDKAKEAADDANARAAKAAAVSEYLTSSGTGACAFTFDAATGKATKYTNETEATTAAASIVEYGQKNDDKVVIVMIDDNGNATTKWVAGTKK